MQSISFKEYFKNIIAILLKQQSKREIKMSENNIAVQKTKKTKKVSYSIQTEVLDEFNKIAKAKDYNKSQTINNLIKMFNEKENSLL